MTSRMQWSIGLCVLVMIAAPQAILGPAPDASVTESKDANDVGLGSGGRPTQPSEIRVPQSLAFEENVGQFESPTRYGVQAGPDALLLASGEATWVFAASLSEGARVRTVFVDANLKAEIAGEGRLPGVIHYYRGSDSEDWRIGGATFSQVRYDNLYPEIDMTYRADHAGRLAYDFVLSPGADPDRILLQFEGADRVSIDTGGALVVSSAGWELRHSPPFAYQEVGGRMVEVPSSFALFGEGRVGFRVSDYNRNLPLVIDPTLAFFNVPLENFGNARGDAIAIDHSGNFYVTGGRSVSGLDSCEGFECTLFVQKRDYGGVVRWTVYIDGESRDRGLGIAVNSAGTEVFVAGETWSSDFPTTFRAFKAAPQSGIGGGFVIKLLTSSGTMVYSTGLGEQVVATSVALDTVGDAVIGGCTWGSLPLVPGASPYDTTFNGGGVQTYGGGPDSFIMKLRLDPADNGGYDADNDDDDLLFSTYLGGSGWDCYTFHYFPIKRGTSVSLDTSGIAYVIGTLVPDFEIPEGNPFPTTDGTWACGFQSPFIAKLRLDGADNGQLNDPGDDPSDPDDLLASTVPVCNQAGEYSPFLSGLGSGIAVDEAGVYVAINGGGATQAILGKMSLDLSQFLYQVIPYDYNNPPTGPSQGADVSVDPYGNAYATGFVFRQSCTESGCTYHDREAFLTKISPIGQIQESYLFEGSAFDGIDDIGMGIRADLTGSAYVIGTRLFQPPDYLGDAFAARICTTPDPDCDGLFDSVDTQPSLYSNCFDDRLPSTVCDTYTSVEGGGSSEGRVLARNGNRVLVTEAPNPQGLQIDVDGAPANPNATFQACPGAPGGFLLSAAPGSSFVLTCGSMTLAVLEGHAMVDLGGIPVLVPAGATATLSEVGPGTFQVTNDRASTADVLVGGAPLVPGASTLVFTNAPRVTITGPAAGSVYAVGTFATFTATFTDADSTSHTAEWRFESSAAVTTIPGTVTEGEGGGSVSDTYAFTTAGVYQVTLTVTDDGGASGTADMIGDLPAFVVVYDPNAGFVTGGGWIPSPPGAFTGDPSATGKASFGFVARYQKGRSLPEGETEFQFQAGDLNFHSASYDWLVCSGPKCQFKGTGTVNGVGGYSFLLTAIDGELPGGGGQDRLRMKIWVALTGQIVYDNQMGDDDFADPTTVIGGGSIVIHKG